MSTAPISAPELGTLLRSLAEADQDLYALVDLANCENQERVLTRIAGTGACLLGDLRREAQLVSPWLVALNARSMARSSWQWIAQLALQSSCMTWLSTALDMRSLLDRLRARTEGELPDGHAVLLRYFDPRVLPVLHQILKPQQRTEFFSLCTTWHFIDRTGQPDRLSAATESVDRFQAPLKLDKEQFVTLLQAAEVDSVMPELVKEATEAFLALAPGERFAFTQRCLREADTAGLESHAHRVLWCLAALEFGEEFTSSTTWRTLTRQVARGELSMAQAIQKAELEWSHVS